MELLGIHHITAIASDAQRNVDFYTGVLGLRLVKVTVNFDDPSSYHLYYGDELGRPGSVLTFFIWPSGRRGAIGNSQVIRATFSIPEGSLAYWGNRCKEHGVNSTVTDEEKTLFVNDPDGMHLALTESATEAPFVPWSSGSVPTAHAIRGFAGATLSAPRLPNTKALFAEILGAKSVNASENKFTFPQDSANAIVTLDGGTLPAGRMGPGVVHHIAFQVSDETEQGEWLKILTGRGYQLSHLMDRSYFKSLYFREPGGVLFELATKGPGFTVDESASTLGQSLKLPAAIEPQRSDISAGLPRLNIGRGVSVP